LNLCLAGIKGVGTQAGGPPVGKSERKVEEGKKGGWEQGIQRREKENGTLESKCMGRGKKKGLEGERSD